MFFLKIRKIVKKYRIKKFSKKYLLKKNFQKIPNKIIFLFKKVPNNVFLQLTVKYNGCMVIFENFFLFIFNFFPIPIKIPSKIVFDTNTPYVDE